MNLKGKFVRMEGERAIFGSKKSPEWKPIAIAGNLYPLELEAGSYYSIDVDDNTIKGCEKLPPPYTGFLLQTGGGSGSYSAQRPSGGSQGSNLHASVAGILKSAIESQYCDPKSHDQMKLIALNAWQVLNSLTDENKRRSDDKGPPF